MKTMFQSAGWAIAAIVLVSGLSGCATHHCGYAAGAAPETSFKKIDASKTGGKYVVYATKTKGPPVLLLHEVNGLSPGSLDLALELEQLGYQVYMPLLFGCYGQDNSANGFKTIWASGSRWKSSDRNDAGPIRQDMHDVTEKICEWHPNQRLTVIGNCLTGALPLELLADFPAVNTAVVCQPALPLFPVSSEARRALALPDDVVKRAIQTLKTHPGKRLINCHYWGDKVAPFDRVRQIASLTREAGCSKRHTVFVGYDTHKETVPDEIQSNGWTAIRTRSSTGHSTVTGARDGDREAYREALFQLLRTR